MTSQDPGEKRATPSEGAESEEQELVERTTAERGGAVSRREPDDPREEEGWTQPESSAQKGAIPDEG
jgi:hypothetical protein